MDKITPSLEAATAATAKGTSTGYVSVSISGIITHMHYVRGGLTIPAPAFLDISRVVCSRAQRCLENLHLRWVGQG